MELRPARQDEAAVLSELAIRSKGHWGYDQVFLDACRAELTIAPDQVERRRIAVAEQGGIVIGFYSLDGDPPHGELGNLFVEPAWIGRGVGRRLWDHMRDRATASGFTEIGIEADPSAQPFYEAMGAEVVGSVPSASIPGRQLPLLRCRFAR